MPQGVTLSRSEHCNSMVALKKYDDIAAPLYSVAYLHTTYGALTDSGTQRFVLSLFLVRPVPTGLAYLTIS